MEIGFFFFLDWRKDKKIFKVIGKFVRIGVGRGDLGGGGRRI